MLDTIFKRRRIRQYTTEAVTEADITKILEAAMAAPSASNRKPWHFVVVAQRANLDALAQAWPNTSKILAKAALAIVVCGDPGISERTWIQDCAAASENLLLAVTALGLGGVWTGVEPNPDRRAAVVRTLGIPEEMGVLNVIAIGHPAEEKEPRTQYDAQRVHRETW